MTLRSKLRAMCAVAAVGIMSAGCCTGGGRAGPSAGDEETVTPSESARVGQRAKGPGSDFSLVIDKGEVAEALGKKKPDQPGAKWVVIRFRLRNDGKEPKSALLEFKELLRDKSGGVYEASTEGSLALTMAEPGVAGSTLDKLAVGAEIKQAAVFAVPGDRIGSEVEMVFEQALALLGDPKKLTIAVPLAPGPASSASVAPAMSP